MTEQGHSKQEPAVKFSAFLAAAVAATALALPSPSLSASPTLAMPDFDHLRGKATDSVDITVDGMLLSIARHFAKTAGEDDADARAALAVLDDIKSVRVRSFEFDSDGAYSRDDIESVRRQLSGPGWSALVQAHKREPKEDVDIFVCVENGKILGLAIIASEPREFTIVNVIGSIDIDKISRLEGQFGIPKLSQND
jgi:hypothetical protein